VRPSFYDILFSSLLFLAGDTSFLCCYTFLQFSSDLKQIVCRVSDWYNYTFHHFWVINPIWNTKLRPVLGWTSKSLSLSVTKLGVDYLHLRTVNKSHCDVDVHVSDPKNITQNNCREDKEILRFRDHCRLLGLSIRRGQAHAFLVHKNVTPCLLRLTATQIVQSVNCSDRYGFKTEEDSCDADLTSEKGIWGAV
jgi:hypothetical protein